LCGFDIVYHDEFAIKNKSYLIEIPMFLGSRKGKALSGMGERPVSS